MTQLYIYLLLVFIGTAKSQERQCFTKGQEGRCGSITQCPKFLQILNQIKSGRSPPNALQTLKGALCNFSGGFPKICCPLETPQIMFTTRRPQNSFQNPQNSFQNPQNSFQNPQNSFQNPQNSFQNPQNSIQNPQNNFQNQFPNRRESPRERGRRLLPDKTKCGRRGVIDNFIVGGRNADLGHWPWMAIFIGRYAGGSPGFFCGGTLINSRYVVSAAHCLQSNNNIQIDYVRLGELDRNRNPDCERGICGGPVQDIRVERIILHPEYSRHCNQCNDIALVRLARDVIFNKINIVPICLPIDPIRDMGYTPQQYKGKTAKAAGFGKIFGDPNNEQTPDKLQEVSLKITDSAFCRQLSSGYRDQTTIFCAGEGNGKDTCKGDSGGPLTLVDEITSLNTFLVGITSLGPIKCGRENSQGLYTNVHSYINWILETIQP